MSDLINSIYNLDKSQSSDDELDNIDNNHNQNDTITNKQSLSDFIVSNTDNTNNQDDDNNNSNNNNRNDIEFDAADYAQSIQDTLNHSGDEVIDLVDDNSETQQYHNANDVISVDTNDSYNVDNQHDDTEHSDNSDSDDEIISLDSNDMQHNNILNVQENGIDANDNSSIASSNTDQINDTASRIVGVGTYISTNDDDNASRRSSKRSRTTTRYYAPIDVTLRCYNCNGVGHYAEDCPYEKMYKSCYLCGLKTHVPWKCPSDLCFKCCLPGHQASQCNNRTINTTICYYCGSNNHNYKQCHGYNDHTYKNDIQQTKCYVCGNLGHINCSNNKNTQQPNKQQHNNNNSKSHVRQCANCATVGHYFTECTQPHMDINISFDNKTGQPNGYTKYDNVNNNNNVSYINKIAEKDCYICGEIGHIAKDCPDNKRRQTMPASTRSNSNYNNNDNYNRRSSYNYNHNRHDYHRESFQQSYNNSNNNKYNDRDNYNRRHSQPVKSFDTNRRSSSNNSEHNALDSHKRKR